jgi:outer membrane protein assembly factor BamB
LLLFATHGRHDDPPGRVVALDRRSGREIWSHAERWAKGKLHDRLTLRDGVLYLVAWDSARYQRGGTETAQTRIRALNAATGAELWAAHINDAWPSTLTVTARHVFFMTSPRTAQSLTILRALDRTTGRVLWTYEGRGATHYWKATSTVHQYRPPLVSAERVALFASDVYVAGIDVDSGRELWRLYEPFTQKFLNQYFLGPMLYVITGDTMAPTVGEFIGIDVTTGEVKWRRDMLSRNRVEATIDGNVLIRTSLLGTTLVEVNGRTGEEIGTVWRHPLFGNASYTICAGPSRSGGLLLLSTSRMEFMGQRPSRGHLYAIRVRPR